MPNAKDYDDKDEFLKICIPQVLEEGTAKDQDQAVAICNSMWDEREEKQMTDKKKETRVLPMTEFRVLKDDGKSKLEGYAAVFNRWSEDLGGFVERIAPNSFKKALKNSDVRALFNHDPNYVLGRSTSGTLQLKEDKKGLHIINEPPNTQWANDLMVSIDRGDISQMSFGFTVERDEWNEDKNGRVTRTIHEIGRLLDVSAVSFPAYGDTSVALRTLEKIKEEKEKPNFELVEEPEKVETSKEEKGSKQQYNFTINAFDADSFMRLLKENIKPLHGEDGGEGETGKSFDEVMLELSDESKEELRQFIIDKVSELLNRSVEKEPEGEPMQADSEKEGENSKPMQGDDEVREFFK